jgi:hypothetical protein
MTTPLLDTRGNMSPKGAAELAATIRNFWLAQGFEGIETRVELEQISSISRHGVWVVRSNMCNGRPPRQKSERSKPSLADIIAAHPVKRIPMGVRTQDEWISVVRPS